MVAKKGLGRGLGSLIESNTDEKNNDNSVNRVIDVDINKITPNKAQPRRSFTEASLSELAESIGEIGIIQPITVLKKGDFYEIITGERRWRAARIAGVKQVPVIVKDFNELQVLEAALIENIQREDLNPLEEAMTYKRFSDEFNLSQESIAKKVGKSRAVVANAMRLLNLDSRVQTFVVENRFTNGHARALLGIEDNDLQFETAEKVIDEELSVRQTEELVKLINEGALQEKEPEKTSKIKNPEETRAILSLARDLKSIFGTKVNIKNGANKGKIEIEYYSNDELDRIVGMIKKIQ